MTCIVVRMILKYRKNMQKKTVKSISKIKNKTRNFYFPCFFEGWGNFLPPPLPKKHTKI
jgi:hypothetical protein